MRLDVLYQELHRQAARTGTDRPVELTGGARLCVRVRDGVTMLSIARADKPLGDREISTFRARCGVPAKAIRWPAVGQHQRERNGATYYQVVYRWEEL
jgi:hypothetical protein